MEDAKFVALAMSLHADSLECVVEHMRSLRSLMDEQDARVAELDRQVAALIDSLDHAQQLEERLRSVRVANKPLNSVDKRSVNSFDGVKAEIATVGASLATARRDSIRTRLDHMEQLQRRAALVPLASLYHRYVAGFAFRKGVAALWSQPFSTNDWERVTRDAIRRLTFRFYDAETSCALDDVNEPLEVHRAVCSINSVLQSRDLPVLHSAHSALPDCLISHFDTLLDASPIMFGAAQFPCASVVLSSSQSLFVPPQCLPHVVASQAPVLPPARHIWTSRFSFESAAQLADLEALRVELQRIAVSEFFVCPRAESAADRSRIRHSSTSRHRTFGAVSLKTDSDL